MVQPFDEYADAREAKQPENILQELEAGITLLMNQDAAVAEQEEKLKEVTARRNKTRFVDLPELMKRAGNMLEHKIQLPFGMVAVAERSKDTSAAMSKGNREYVLKFMMDNGYAHLISSDIVSSFTAGQKEEYEVAISKMKAAGLDYTEQQTVQSSRYTAWCDRMVHASKITPEEFGLFGIHIVEQVKVKVKDPKARKGRGTTE